METIESLVQNHTYLVAGVERAQIHVFYPRSFDAGMLNRIRECEVYFDILGRY